MHNLLPDHAEQNMSSTSVCPLTDKLNGLFKFISWSGGTCRYFCPPISTLFFLKSSLWWSSQPHSERGSVPHHPSCPCAGRVKARKWTGGVQWPWLVRSSVRWAPNPKNKVWNWQWCIKSVSWMPSQPCCFHGCISWCLADFSSNL